MSLIILGVFLVALFMVLGLPRRYIFEALAGLGLATFVMCLWFFLNLAFYLLAVFGIACLLYMIYRFLQESK